MDLTPVHEPSLQDLVRLLRRRRLALVATAITALCIALLALVLTTKRYEAVGVVEQSKSSTDQLSLSSVLTSAAASSGSDDLSPGLDLETEVNVLSSDTLALQVIKELHLENAPDFRPQPGALGKMSSIFAHQKAKAVSAGNVDTDPVLRSHLTTVFESKLKVKNISGTRLIEVRFSSPDPHLAAEVVNHLIQADIDFSFQTKFTATNNVSGWLVGQLGNVRKQSEDLQLKLAKLQEQSGLYGIGSTDPTGKEMAYSPLLDRLQQSSVLLSQAETARILKGAIYEAAKTGDAEMISSLAGNSIMGQQGVEPSGGLLTQLRTQLETLHSQIANDTEIYGESYSKLKEEHASAERLQRSIQEEIKRIQARAKSDYVIAQQTEAGARERVTHDQQAAESANGHAIEYEIQKKEADQQQSLYEDLFKNLKEAGVLESLHSSDLSIIDPARVPAFPNTPKPLIYILAGVLGGLILGLATAWLVDTLDNRIRSVSDLESLGLPVLGVVPQVKNVALTLLPQLQDRENHSFNEAISAIRNSILLSRGGSPPRVILTTSASPGEGKSLVSLASSVAMAHFGRKVLLVEVDMRRPTLQRRLQQPLTRGLSELLSGDDTIGPTAVADHDNLWLIPSGAVPPYPGELLGSERFKELLSNWTNEYEFVILDCPPMLPVADVQAIQALADFILLVVRADKTSRTALTRVMRSLLRPELGVKTPPVGVVLNAVRLNSSLYYEYYGYSGYSGASYYGTQDSNDK